MKIIKPLFVLIVFISVSVSVSCSSGTKKADGPLSAATEKQPVEAFGTVVAGETTEIGIGFPVRIKRINVCEGEAIRENCVLAEIDTNTFELELKLKEQEAAALKTEAALLRDLLEEKKSLLESGNDPDLALLEKRLENANTAYKDAQNVLSVNERLLSSGAISKEDFKASSDKIRAAGNAVEELALSLESLRHAKRTEILQEEIQFNGKTAEISKLELEREIMLGKLTGNSLQPDKILSKIPRGIVGGIFCKAGETVAADKPVFSVLNLDTLIVEAGIDEQFIEDVRVGARAYIVPELDRSAEYKGRVIFISSAAVQQNAETVIPVRIALDKKETSLLPGCNVEINISVD